MQRNDPVSEKRVPTVGEASSMAPGDCFTPSALSRTAMVSLHRALERKQRRRTAYQGSPLRVCVDGDGEERWQCDPGEGVCGPFSVPVGASYLEVFGDDDHSALLLAVVPLPDPAEVEGHQPLHWYVTLEGGQTVTIEIALGDTTSGELNEYCIHIGYFGPAGVDN